MEELFGRTSESAFDAFQQLFRFERLWKKVDGAGLHRLGAHRDVAVASYKDKLLFAAALNQGFLEVDPVQPRHLHVNNHAGRSRMRGTGEKFGSRLEEFRFVLGNV